MVEQYVKLRDDTQPIEDKFKVVFREFWEESARVFAPRTRNMLLSGEYVWYEYQKTNLNDWAAPVVQYCRALEYEVKRRIYSHHPSDLHDPDMFKTGSSGWTIGTLNTLYYRRNDRYGDIAIIERAEEHVSGGRV